nr:hypothetical protein [Tanacetum cinerariifolium]
MESMETVHETTHSPKVIIWDDAIIPTSVGRMTTIIITLTIPNNKTMVTYQGMRVVIHLTSNKITNNKAPTNKGHKKNKNQGQGPSNGQQSNVDQKFDLILSELAKSNQGANLKFESLSKSVVNLERQIGQLAEEVHKREAGKLPSYPDLNPKHKPGGPEHVNMVTSLRNGKKADNVKFNFELVNDLLKDFPKPPTQNPEATKSPKVGEGGVSSTTTPYPAALENQHMQDWLKRVLILRICGRLSSK